jgi:RNA polymerase sigma-70 factor (ECF subfamily)
MTMAARDDDRDLVAQAVNGDHGAFATLVRRHEARTFRLIHRLAGNRADAEEILQDTFLRVYRKLHTYDRRARFTTWLYRVAVNTARMHRRAAGVRRAESLESYLPGFTRAGRHRRIDVDYSAAARVEARVSASELSRVLLQALTRLPERYRAAFVLRDLHELPSREAAAILSIDERALRQRVHRARLMLRGYLGAVAGSERA